MLLEKYALISVLLKLTTQSNAVSVLDTISLIRSVRRPVFAVSWCLNGNPLDESARTAYLAILLLIWREWVIWRHLGFAQVAFAACRFIYGSSIDIKAFWLTQIWPISLTLHTFLEILTNRTDWVLISTRHWVLYTFLTVIELLMFGLAATTYDDTQHHKW